MYIFFLTKQTMNFVGFLLGFVSVCFFSYKSNTHWKISKSQKKNNIYMLQWEIPIIKS